MTDWWREAPINRHHARVALEDAREHLTAQRIHLLFLCDLVRVLADRRVPPRACDEPAERIVLGWLLSERCRPEDFAELGAYDFASPEHRWIFPVGLSLVEMVAERQHATLYADRGFVLATAGLMTPERAGRIETALWRLPYVATLPQREIDLVASLGRGWSRIDEAFNVEPFEVT